MGKGKGKEPELRDRAITIKMTEDEKRNVMEFAAERSLNLSALVRGLLSDYMASAGAGAGALDTRPQV